MPTRRIGKTKNKLPLSLRVAHYRFSMDRERKRYSEKDTPSYQGHWTAINDTLAMLPITRYVEDSKSPDVVMPDDQITAHLLEVYPRLEAMAAQQGEFYRQRAEQAKADDLDPADLLSVRDRMAYHKGAAYEYLRQFQQVKNLLNDLPED